MELMTTDRLGSNQDRVLTKEMLTDKGSLRS
jgi:hypothetical protein